MALDDVQKWMKRLNRHKPFYLYFKSPTSNFRTNTIYTLIWNDKNKTKIGTVEDHMYCRYGINTCAVLNGESMLDVWNGQTIDEEQFLCMLEVRRHISNLPIFELSELQNLRW